MERTLTSILGNAQRLDGGAMFGNAPKAMWSKWVDVDDQNRITLATRAFLIREPTRTILLETGIGAFFEPKLKKRYGVIGDKHILLASLDAIGLKHEDIDIVILSHLHFDHAGGLLTGWEKTASPALLFPNAQYIVSQAGFNRARNPHPRDHASFITFLPELLEQSGRLVLVDDEDFPLLGKDYRFHFSDGHTPGLMLTEVAMPEGPVIYGTDLVPGVPWVHLPITMGYDRYPEQLIDEKKELLDYLVATNGQLLYTHDPTCAMSRIKKDDNGRFRAVDCVGDGT